MKKKQIILYYFLSLSFLKSCSAAEYYSDYYDIKKYSASE